MNTTELCSDSTHRNKSKVLEIGIQQLKQQDAKVKMLSAKTGTLLRKFGISENDVNHSEKLLAQIPPLSPSRSTASKVERLTGYAHVRLVRVKALRLMGVNEEEIDMENAKNLGALGVSGRRRSFTIVKQREIHTRLSLIRSTTKLSTQCENRSKSNVIRRRRSSGMRKKSVEILVLKRSNSLGSNGTSTRRPHTWIMTDRSA